jgi:hypothetical protein
LAARKAIANETSPPQVAGFYINKKEEWFL